jgi:hypothetical protein
VLGAPPLFFVLSLAFIKARECHAVASKYWGDRPLLMLE